MSRSVVEHELETASEIAVRFRLCKKMVRAAAASGQVKCVERVFPGGRKGYLIDVADARRLWGAK